MLHRKIHFLHHAHRVKAGNGRTLIIRNAAPKHEIALDHALIRRINPVYTLGHNIQMRDHADGVVIVAKHNFSVIAVAVKRLEAVFFAP